MGTAVDSLEIQIQTSAQKANQEIDKLVANIGKLASSLKIDTSGLEKIGKALNFSGIDKAAKNIQSQMADVIKSVNSQMKSVSKNTSEVAKNFQDKFKNIDVKVDFSKPEAELRKFQNQANTAQNALTRIMESSTADKQISGIEKWSISLAQANNAISILEKHISQMQASQPNIDFKISGIEEVEQKISSVSEKIRSVAIPESAFGYNADAMKAVFGEMASGIENWSQAAQKFGENAGAVLNQTVVKTDNLNEKTKQFEQSLKNLQIPPINTNNLGVLKKQFGKAEENFEKLKIKLENGISMGKISANVEDKGFRSLKEQMAIAEKQAEALKNKIREVENTSGKTTYGIKNFDNSLKSASSSLSNLSTSSTKAIRPLNNLGNSFRSLIRTMLPILGIQQLFNWGKQATEIASDLTEVQNVVDVTFGNMAYKLEEFADISIEKFGLSELSLKEYASRYQAMGAAIGFPTDQMSDMSVELTKLTADMASFYNVEQKAVAEDLQSIFTGTTMPLRQYGLDLTQATLQEWALKQGIDADIKSMSQAEKTMLRYQYVLANTTAAQGDFARTADTWANQLRILKQNFQQLGSIVGGVLINVFKPFVQALNSVAQKVIQFAKTIANALGKIFGWKLEISTGGITDDIGGVADYADQAAGGLEDGADAAEDEADNLDKAQKAAKKLKDHTLGIDELNIVRPEDIEAIDDIADKLPSIKKPASGGGGGAGAGGGGDISSDLIKTSSIFDNFKSDIDTLYELGEYIGKVLTDAMNSIDWDKIYGKARGFGKGLADFLNGLISPELFGALGRTIAGSLNTALHFLDSFGERFDWKDFGLSIATGINEFFATFDFALLAHTINTWAHGILDTIIEFIDKTNWNMIGVKIGEFLADLDFIGVGAKVGKAIWKAINAGIDMWKGMFKSAPFETIIITLAGFKKAWESIIAVKVIPWIKNVVDGLKTLGIAISALAGNKSALSALTAEFPKLGKAVDVSRKAFENFRFGIENGNFMSGLNEGISTIRNNLTGMQKGIITVAAAFLEFNIVSDVFEGLTLGTEGVIEGLSKIGVAVAATGAAMYVALGPAGLVITAITGVVAAVKGIGDAMDEVSQNISMDAIAETMQNPGGVPISEISNKYVEMANTIKEQFDGINQKSQELETTRGNIEETANSLEPYVFAIQNGATVTDESVTKMNESFQRLLNESSTLLEQESLIIYQALAGNLGDAVVAAGGSIDEYILATDRLKTESQKQLEEISESLGKLKEDYENNKLTQEEYANSMIDLITRYKELKGGGDEAQSAISGLNDIVSAGIDWSKISDVSDLTNEIEKVGTSFTDAKEVVSTSGQEIIETINKFIEEAKTTGNVEAETAFTQLLKYQEQEIARQTGEIDKLAGEYTQMIQDSLLNKVPEIFSEAESSWEELSGWEKFWIPKENTVNDAITTFDTEYIQPLQNALENSFGTFGESSKPYANTAMETILDGLIEPSRNPNIHAGYLTENIEGLVANALDGAKENSIANAEEFGADTVKGFGTGISESIDFSKDPIDIWMGKIFNFIHDSVMRFGSPSLTAKEFGKDTIDGFNKGIDENKESTKSFISAWMESVSEFFSKEIWTEKFNGIKDGFMTKWQEISEWFNSEFMPVWFEEGIMSWFSFEKWHDELLLNIPLAFQTTWEEITAWWNEEAMLVWWEEYVNPWFEIKKWQMMFDNIHLAFVAEWKIIVDWWNKSLDAWWKDNVLPRFTKEKWFEMLENVRNAFEETWQIIKEKTDKKMEETYQVVRSWCDEMLSAIAEISSAIDGVISKLKKIKSMNSGVSIGIKGFATGGFPETGQLFLARENGPEMIGSMSGHTAVANNDQIVEGIAIGVRQAVAEILVPYLSDIANSNRDIANKETSVVIGDSDIVDAYRRGSERMGWQF